MKMFSGRTTVFVLDPVSAGRRPSLFVIGRLIHVYSRAIPLRNEPVEPRFDISSWQEQTATVVSCDGRKAALSESVSDFLFPHCDSLAILIEKSKDTPSFGETGKVGDFFHKPSLDPVMSRATLVDLGFNLPAVNASRLQKTSRETGVAPTLADDDNFANPAHFYDSVFERRTSRST